MELYFISAIGSENADSHAGRHGDFQVFWSKGYLSEKEGWYWYEFPTGITVGPFHTSQEAFGNRKDKIDEGYQCHEITLN